MLSPAPERVIAIALVAMQLVNQRHDVQQGVGGRNPLFGRRSAGKPRARSRD